MQKTTNSFMIIYQSYISKIINIYIKIKVPYFLRKIDYFESKLSVRFKNIERIKKACICKGIFCKPNTLRIGSYRTCD
jgi:hypothetical protein